MKYIKFIVILFITLIIMGFTAPSQSYIDWSEGGNFRWGVFDGFYPYSDSTYIGVDTVPVWKIYIKNGYIDSLYAIEYIDTIYKIHKITEIDTIFKVHIDTLDLDSGYIKKLICDYADIDTFVSDSVNIRIVIADTVIADSVNANIIVADTAVIDSIETNELLVKNNAMVEDTARLKYLKWYNNNDKAIYCLSVFQWSLGHLSANSDSVIVGGDTTTRWNAGAMIYETNKNELLIYDGHEWEANAEVYVNGLDTVAVGSVNTWITAKLWTAGLSGGALIVGDSVIVVKSKGVYDVDGHLNCSSETVNHTFQWGVSVNSAVPAVKTRGIEKFTNTDWGSLATGCRLDLSIDDTLRFQVMDTLSGSPCDLYVLYGNIGIEKR